MLKEILITETLKIQLYNLLIGVGILIGIFVFEKQTIIYKNLKSELIIYAIIFSIIFGFIGSFLFDIFTKGYSIDLSLLSNIGFTFYGGIILGSLAYFVIIFVLKINFQYGTNIIVPSLLISHSFGRIGCFLGGCCYGSPTNCFLGVSFPENSIAWLHWGNLHLHPVQLYESAILFVLFLISLNISFSNRYIFYLFTYGFVRFILEFIRGDERGYLLNISILSPSQIISLVLISISIIAFIYKSI